jgi:coenzyme F420-reducing hydrogenase delta subunit
VRDGIIISSYFPTQCNYLQGNIDAVNRVEVMKKAPDTLGIGSEYLETIFTSACEPM